MAQANRSMVNMLLLGVAVVALVVLVYFLAVQSQTDDSTHTAGVSNQAPTVENVLVSMSTPTGGGDGLESSYGTGEALTTVGPVSEETQWNFYIYGYYTDNNGCDTVTAASSFDAAFYKKTLTSSCTPDQADCHQITCDEANTTVSACGGGSDLVGQYLISYPMPYYAVSTNGADSTYSADTWQAWVEITDTDASPLADTQTSADIEMGTLTAFDFDTASINYGDVALGANSAEQTVVFEQTGNITLDFEQTSANAGMVCDGLGTIPWANVLLTDTSGDYTTAPIAMKATGAGTATIDMDLAVWDNGTASQPTESWYFRLTMPSTGVRGDCSNAITFSAVPSSTY